MIASIRTRSSVLFMLLALAGFVAPRVHAQSATTLSNASKIRQLLGSSGYEFTQKTDTVWVVPYHGKSLKNFTVILAVQDDLLVTFVNPATKAQMSLTPDFMQKLLSFNHTLDRVKIGLDADGDLFVRVDSTVRILDVEELKAVVEQVAAATDEIYKDISPSLLSQSQ